MGKNRARRKTQGPGPARAASASSQRDPVPHPLLPVAVVTLLCVPGLFLGFFWDDFYYLTRGQEDPLTYLLPRAGAMSYRPLPEGLFFLALAALSPWTRNLGHFVNLALVAASVFLLVRLVSRLSSPRAGVLAGIVFAGLGALPTVVAWTSCAPEAFALFFSLLALTWRHADRNARAFVAAAAAVFSKESALILFPILIFWDTLVGRAPNRAVRNAPLYGGLAVLWLFLHPGFQSLLKSGFRIGQTGYLGAGGAGQSSDYFLAYFLTLLNIPVLGTETPWPDEVAVFGILAIAALLAWLVITRKGSIQKPATGRLSLRRTALLALWITVPLILLPSALVARWNPYFACLPMIGVALIAGVLLARAPVWLLAVVLPVYLLCGVWCRGLVIPGGLVLTERACVDASQAMKRVERGFQASRASFPPRSQALVSVGESGLLGVYGSLIDGQALRIWYEDPTLTTRLPRLRQAGASGDYLFRVGYDLKVWAIDPDRKVESKAATPEELFDERRALRSYARGLAASGEHERGVTVLERLYLEDPADVKGYDLRLAAMIRFAQGKREEALSYTAVAGTYPRQLTLNMIARLLRERTESAALDSCAIEAFGLSRSDPVVIAHLRSTVEGEAP